ncbi:MAG: hypothetical protein K6G80_06930 [Treponema sp.]|nr:hypothetical protein [Treponema sp.]
MKKTLLAHAALFVFAVSLLFPASRGAQELIPSGHWIYDALEALSLESETLSFADSAPLSISRIRAIMAEIDYDSLSEPGRANYDRIESYFAEEQFSIASDLLSFSFEPALNLEGYWKSNDDIDWVYDRYSRSGLFEMPVTIDMGDYVSMGAVMELSENQGAMQHEDNYSSIPASADEVDANFPHWAWLSTGASFSQGSGVQFMLNQGTQSVGRTQGGSVIISDYMTGATTAKLSFYAPSLQYSAAVTELNVDKYFYYHQLDARFFKRLSVSFLEGIAVYAPLELRYLNPWTIFHGFAPWRDYGDYDGDRSDSDPESHTCAYFGAKLDFTPCKGIRFYGLMAMTQYQTPYERKNWPDSPTPDGLGFQGGTEWYLPLQKGYFHFGLEGYYAQPYLYIKESPNWSLVRTYSENMGDKAVFYEWIGSPYGPDTISGELTAGYDRPGIFSVDFTYLFMARGEMSGTSVFDPDVWGGQKTALSESEAQSSWCYPTDSTLYKTDWTTPTGTPEYVNRLSVRATWQAKPYLKLTAQPAYVLIFNHNHEHGETARGFEMALALELSFLKF